MLKWLYSRETARPRPSRVLIAVSGLALFLAAWVAPISNAHLTPNLTFKTYPEYSEGGYADKRTALQGEQITFYIANTLERFSARILRVADSPGSKDHVRVMLHLRQLHGNSPELGCTPQHGCDWRPTYTLTIPNDWPSGWYRVEFPVKHADDPRHIDFIVAERRPSAPILFIFDMQTAQAYNVYGGASFYGGFDASGTWTLKARANQLSFRRPLVRSHSYSEKAVRITNPVWIPHEEEAFRLWLEQRFSVAYISNDAVERVGLEYLKRYPLMVIVGTQEYWTNRQLALVESYVLGGGNLYLSAVEFAYGAIRFEAGDSIRYFHDPREDPVLVSSPADVATVRAAVSDPENFFGVSLELGQGLGISQEFSPLTVVNARSWVFNGLGYANGDALAGVRGLGVGALVKKRGEGRYCITSSRIPCDRIDVLAIAPYPPLNIIDQAPFDQAAVDSHIDGRIDHTLTTIPDKTFAVVALIRQGDGEMFVGPGGWWNLPHPNNIDPRVRQVIENVIRRLSGRSRE